MYCKSIMVAMVLSFTYPVFAENAVKEKSISDYPALVTLFNLMSEYASEGPSIASFSYSQDFWFEGKIATCDTVMGADLTPWIQDFMNGIIFDDQSGDAVKSGLKDFETFIGEGSYYHCTSAESGFMAMTFHDYLIAKDGSVRLMLSVGSED